jgi:hypothetical protein
MGERDRVRGSLVSEIDLSALESVLLKGHSFI